MSFLISKDSNDSALVALKNRYPRDEEDKEVLCLQIRIQEKLKMKWEGLIIHIFRLEVQDFFDD